MRVIQRRPDTGYLDTLLWCPKSKINVEGVKNALTFATSERNSVRVFTLFKETRDHLLVPREFWKSEDCDFPIVDCRVQGFPFVDIQSKIKLDHLPDANGILQPTGKDYQQEAVRALLEARGGILQLACGKGKTVIFLHLISILKVPTIIVIDNTQLLGQWQQEAAQHLIVPGGTGLIQGDVFDWKKPLVLTTYQTLAQRADTFPEEARRWFGLVGWDEGHHVGAPTFSKTADLFSGRRILLTATPERSDGQHVIYRFHIGDVLYKDLKQDLRPQINFLWTGFSLDKSNPLVRAATEDKNNELHIGKIAGYLGQWKERLKLILDLSADAISHGRKVLVLSNAVDTLVNLYSMWLGEPGLFTDLLRPTPNDVGETVEPQELDERKLKKTRQHLHAFREALRTESNPVKRQNLHDRIYALDQAIQQHECWKKIETRHDKNRRDYVKDLINRHANADAGLMIYQVPREVRSRLIHTKSIVFAVSKYGREGLDSKDLDTIIACEPMSNRNGLQQFMGRILRNKENKKTPIAVFLEDDIGPMIGMCNNLRRHLRDWSVDEGGPYAYDCIGHPTSFRRQGKSWTKPSIDFST